MGVEISIISNEEAFDIVTGNTGAYVESILCTYSPGTSAAGGDSGGPVVVGYGNDPKLVGVHSFGASPQDQNPSMHANVFELSNFIDNALNGVFDVAQQWEINGTETISHENFRGEIIINNGGELVINGTLDMMSAESRITVRSGGRLVVNHLGVITSCDEEWHGIDVEAGPNFLVVPPPPAEVLINGGTIEYAEIGIRTQNVLFFTGMPLINTTSSFGGSNAKFMSCDTAIQTHYQGIWNGIPEDQSSIGNTDFIDCGVGVDLMNIKSINIIGCHFQNNTTGIQGVNVSPFIDGLNLAEPNFSNCKRGVFLSFPSGQNQKTDIINSHFSNLTSNVTTGIHIQSGAGNNSEAFTNVVDNTFEGWTRGFNAQGANFYLARNNTFTGQSYRSLLANACGSETNEVNLNRFENSLRGSVFEFDNSDTYINQNCYSNNSWSDAYVSGAFPNQGSAAVSNGNCFGSAIKISATNDVDFTYFVPASGLGADACFSPPPAGGMLIDDSNSYKTAEDCGDNNFNGNIPPHDDLCNPDKTESDVNTAINNLNNLILSIANDGSISQAEKEALIEYYQRCLKKAKLLLVTILKEDDRVDDAVNVFVGEGEFSMRVKGYSLLVEYGRLQEARNYLSSLTTSSDEEIDFIDVQNIYLDALLDQAYTPKSSDLSFLYSVGQRNTVFAGYAASVYFYLTGEIIEGVIHDVDPRNSEFSKSESNIKFSIYPNPFTDNLINISIDGYDSNSTVRAEVYDVNGRLISSQAIINTETQLIFPKDLEKGIYFYKVYINNEEYQNGKLVRI
jgi:hypothetical protein